MTAQTKVIRKELIEFEKLYKELYSIEKNYKDDELIQKVTEVIHSWMGEIDLGCEFVIISIKDTDKDIHRIKYVSSNKSSHYLQHFEGLMLPHLTEKKADSIIQIEKISLSSFIDKLQKANDVHLAEDEKGEVIVDTVTFVNSTIDIIFGFPQGTGLTDSELDIITRLAFPIGTYITGLWANSQIKEQLRLKDEITQRIKKLEQQKDEFVSMAAHELRSPMTAIKGYLSMVIEGDAGQISEKARGFLADANSINERIIRLVNNMLNVSRIEEGRLAYQMEYEYLTNIVKLVFHQFIPEAERKGLKFELKIPHEIRDRIYVDIDKVNEVIGNLVSNAVKYTDEGHVLVRLIQPEKDVVRFEVEDTGTGITKEEQRKLFRKFYRVESNVGKTTGTGLGLYISKLLIEKFGGKIGIESEFGKGSKFWFELPVTEVDKIQYN